jgi:predicted TIM-barrel fold metal-dependent hydrolase
MLDKKAEDEIIDLDGHVLMEAAEDWQRFFTPADARALEADLAENRRHWYGREGLDVTGIRDSIRERAHGSGGWDSSLRLRDMDTEGIDRVVLFPTEIGLKRGAYPASICRGYNDWLADYCSADPERLMGVAMVPLDDPVAAARELERAIGVLGFVGVFMKNSVNGRMCDDVHYDPLYAATEALGVPLLLHIPSDLKELVEDRFGYDFLRSHVLHPVSEMLSLMDVIYGGVLDRFPRLRVGYLEGQVGWLPWYVARLDDQVETYGSRPGLDPNLRRRPSEYFDERRLFFSCDIGEPYLEFAARAELTPGIQGMDCIVWGSDYPHSDAIFPGALDTFRKTSGLNPQEQAQITGTNARQLLFGRD